MRLGNSIFYLLKGDYKPCPKTFAGATPLQAHVVEEGFLEQPHRTCFRVPGFRAQDCRV